MTHPPWAKLSRHCSEGRGAACRNRCECPITARLSVIGHAADVASVMCVLLERPVIAGRLAALLQVPALAADDCDRLVALTALHDVGKVNRGFQLRPFPGSVPAAGHIAPVIKAFDDSG